jgi:hypothetical protein
VAVIREALAGGQGVELCDGDAAAGAALAEEFFPAPAVPAAGLDLIESLHSWIRVFSASVSDWPDFILLNMV